MWIGLGGLTVAALAVVAAADSHARTDAWPVLEIGSFAVHLLAAGVWVGGLGALVGLAAPGRRQLRPKGPALLLGELLPRFSRVAVVAVAVVVATGVVNTTGQLSSVADLRRVSYGQLLVTKVVLVLVALGIAFGHRYVVPARLANPRLRTRDVAATVGDFDHSSRWELSVLAGVVAVAAALVAMVPGRTAALEGGLVNRTQRAGPYTVQLLVDPSAAGANQLHLTFTGAGGLAASRLSNVKATLARTDQPAPPATLQVRLLASGDFVADATLAAPARYRLAVQAVGTPASFEFAIRQQAG